MDAGRGQPGVTPRSLRLASLLDARFQVPGTGFPFGLDPILGLVPVVGDTLALALGLMIVYDAAQAGVRRRGILRMLLNLGVYWAIGSIPFVGDVADFFIKPNRANLRLLKRELGVG